MGTRSEVQHQHGETLQTLTDHKAKSLELLKDPPQIHIDYREDEPYCFCFFFFSFFNIFFCLLLFLLLLSCCFWLLSSVYIIRLQLLQPHKQSLRMSKNYLFIITLSFSHSFSVHVLYTCHYLVALMLTPRDPAGPLISAGLLLILPHNKVTCWGDAVFDKPQFSPITIKTKTQKAENKEK